MGPVRAWQNIDPQAHQPPPEYLRALRHGLARHLLRRPGRRAGRPRPRRAAPGLQPRDRGRRSTGSSAPATASAASAATTRRADRCSTGDSSCLGLRQKDASHMVCRGPASAAAHAGATTPPANGLRVRDPSHAVWQGNAVARACLQGQSPGAGWRELALLHPVAPSPEYRQAGHGKSAGVLHPATDVLGSGPPRKAALTAGSPVGSMARNGSGVSASSGRRASTPRSARRRGPRSTRAVLRAPRDG